MKKHVAFFITAFALGCAGALTARTAWFQPYEGASAPAPARDYAQQVSNPAAPAADPHAAPASPHAGHGKAAPAATVNTVCAICGMDVNPSIKPATYHGQLIGFGCRGCPAQFAADPERYGPSALQNKVVSP